jgi:hypothetical protein
MIFGMDRLRADMNSWGFIYAFIHAMIDSLSLNLSILLVGNT